MPPLETTDRYQEAVLWPWAGQDGYNEPLMGPPVEIMVRWLDGQRETAGPQGSPVSIDATVILEEAVTVGSHMWLGTLEDWYGSGSAGDATSIMEVVTYNPVSDIKNRFVRHTAGLAWFRDTPAAQG